MDNKSDLLQYARDFANQNEDLYTLLGVDATTPKEGIHRAWRKRSLKYHPDKAGKDFDATAWQQFERARDVLSDAGARAAYDGARSAALLREAQRRDMDARRRWMIEDLEARERGVKRPRPGDRDDEAKKNAMSEEERQRLIAAGNRRMEERRRLMREAEERERLRELEKMQQQQQPQPQPQPQPQDHPRPKRSFEGGDIGSGSGGKTTIPDDPPIPDASAVNEGGDGDDLDERIAALERRLKENQAKKAEKEARRAARKAEKASSRKENKKTTAATWKDDDGDVVMDSEPSREAQEKQPTQNPGVTELKADDVKRPPPQTSPAPKTPPFLRSAAPSSAAATATMGSSYNTYKKSSDDRGDEGPPAKVDFSHTMARLRAAQAAKEAKKKAEQEAATATAATAVVGGGDGSVVQ